VAAAVAASENEANLERAVAAWNAGDLPGYLELYDEAITLHGYAPVPLDKQAVRAFYESVFAAFDQPQLVFHERLSDEERICVRFTMTGTHNGEFMGIPPTGRPVALEGMTILHFQNGKCVERWSNTDMLGLLSQLGAVPPPG
jgi:predicted ester cyclase